MDTVNDFSIAFYGKDNLNDQMASRILKKHKIVVNTISTLPGAASILYFRKGKEYSYLDFSSSILYEKVTPVDFIMRYEYNFNSSTYVKNFHVANELGTPPILSTLKPRVYTYSFTTQKKRTLRQLRYTIFRDTLAPL